MTYKRPVVAIRTCVALFVALLLSLHLTAQNVPTPPTAEQQKAESDYAAMVVRVQQGDMSIDFRAFRVAGAWRSGPHSSALETAERSAFRKLAASGDWTSALNSAKHALDRNYASPIAQYDAMLAYQKLRHPDEAAVHEKILNALLDSISRSGDGKSPEKAYFVVTVQEEYIFLNRVLHLRGRSQAWVRKDGHFYDRLQVVDPNTNPTSDIWFNADFDSSDAVARATDKDGVLATTTVARPSTPQEAPHQEPPSEPATTPPPSNQLGSTSFVPQPSAEKSNAESEPVIRWGNFHLVQGGVPWSLTYSVSGTYKLRPHSVTMSIESGSARISDSRPADETNQLSVPAASRVLLDPRW